MKNPFYYCVLIHQVYYHTGVLVSGVAFVGDSRRVAAFLSRTELLFVQPNCSPFCYQ